MVRVAFNLLSSPSILFRSHYFAFTSRQRLKSGYTMASGSPQPESSTQQTSSTVPLTMQIVVRRDLLDEEGWGVGPLMAQVAHATAAVLHETRDTVETRMYLDDLKNMRKTVLQTSSLASLEKLSTMLSSTDPPIPHHLWIEQPENVATCLALAPNRRDSKIKKALDKSGCRLWKA